MHGAELVGARLSQLRTRWSGFMQRATARLLVWRAEPEEVALVSLFVDVEADAERAETADLILQLTSPFTDAATHGHTLTHELIAQYAEAIAEEPTDAEPPWSLDPAPSDEHDDVGALLRALASFHRHHFDVQAEGRLGVWLALGDVSDWPAYLCWLRRLVRCAPAELRFFVVDADPTPAYRALVMDEPERVELACCALKVPDMLEALAAGSGEATQEDRYRALMVRLGNAREGLERARAWAEEATEIAVGCEQFALAALAHLMLAAACSRHEQAELAVQHYAEAERFAARQEAKESADEVPTQSACGAKVRLMAKLGAAAALLMQGSSHEAGTAYLEAAPLARAAEDVGTELDCHRLASLCLAQQGLASLAWEVGMRGLGTGLDLPEEPRRAPAVLLLAAQMLQLTRENRALRHYEPSLAEKLSRALGADWQDMLGAAGAT